MQVRGILLSGKSGHFASAGARSMNAGFVMGEAGDIGESGEGGSSDL